MTTPLDKPQPGHWPREHGAWAQLLVPLAAALLGGQPGIVAALLALAAVALFAAHEPLLVWRGQRGKRVQQEQGQAALRHLVQRLVVAALAGGGALLLAPQPVVVASLAVLPLGALQMALTLADKHKSLVGEWLAGTALAAAALPVAVAAGTPVHGALLAALIWSVGFALMTTAVHACKARALQQPTQARLMALALLAATTALALAAWQAEARPLAPMAVAAMGLAVAPIRLRFMSRVGWLLAVASLLTLSLQVWAVRAAAG